MLRLSCCDSAQRSSATIKPLCSSIFCFFGYKKSFPASSVEKIMKNQAVAPAPFPVVVSLLWGPPGLFPV